MTPNVLLLTSRYWKVKQATKRGLRALAIHTDSLAAAKLTGRNLWKEAADGLWDMLYVSPEMLSSPPFGELILNPKFLAVLRYFFVDEMHLAEEWGAQFRPIYREVGAMRTRLPSRVTWGAWTATLGKGLPRKRVSELLGFLDGQHIAVDLPTD